MTFALQVIGANNVFAHMPEVKYENLIASNTQTIQKNAEKTHFQATKRMKIQRSIASEANGYSDPENRTKILGYIFILALPLFLGLWLMKVKGP